MRSDHAHTTGSEKVKSLQSWAVNRWFKNLDKLLKNFKKKSTHSSGCLLQSFTLPAAHRDFYDPLSPLHRQEHFWAQLWLPRLNCLTPKQTLPFQSQFWPTRPPLKTGQVTQAALQKCENSYGQAGTEKGQISHSFPLPIRCVKTKAETRQLQLNQWQHLYTL